MTKQFFFKSLPIAFLAFFIAAGLSAQSEGKKTKPAPKENMEANEAKADEEFAKDLKLTPEQRAAFKKSNEEYRAKTKANRTAKKEDMQKMREERNRAQKAVLTPEQAKKFDEMQAKREAKHEHKQGEKAAKKTKKKEHKAEKKEVKSENKEIKKELKKQ